MSDKQLRPISAPHPQATILDFRDLPGMKGDEEENLLCGGCSAVLGEGVSEQTLRNQFATSVQLAVKCPECGGYSTLPSQWMPANAAFG